jgi:outer membrane immunogenic protein
MTKKTLLVGAFMLAGAAAVIIPASAADMYRPDVPVSMKDTPVYIPANTWTGFYIGVNGGGAWQNETAKFHHNNFAGEVIGDTPTFSGLAGGLPQTSFDVRGAVGGGQLGYNWQFNKNWLVGIEADFDGSSIHGSGTSNFIFPGQRSTDEKIDWFGTARARLGFITENHLLIFGTGGVAFGQVGNSAAVSLPKGANISRSADGSTEFCLPSQNPCMTGSNTRTQIGWTAGAGAEYALTSRITIKAEYLRVDLGDSNFHIVGRHPVSDVPANATGESSTALNVVRAGINYHIGEGYEPLK